MLNRLICINVDLTDHRSNGRGWLQNMSDDGPLLKINDNIGVNK